MNMYMGGEMLKEYRCNNVLWIQAADQGADTKMEG